MGCHRNQIHRDVYKRQTDGNGLSTESDTGSTLGSNIPFKELHLADFTVSPDSILSLIHIYMGRVGLINSGGESHGESDLHDAVVTAVVNKRAGGMGLISGRKAFQKPMKDGVQLLNTIQDVYLDSSITIA